MHAIPPVALWLSVSPTFLLPQHLGDRPAAKENDSVPVPLVSSYTANMCVWLGPGAEPARTVHFDLLAIHWQCRSPHIDKPPITSKL